MLVELHVRDLGVIADLDLALEPGMTALTGETGAGKTLVVEALELLVGGRADAAVVRGGCAEALVEGRFVDDADEEAVLARAVSANGRSRAFLDGRMVPVAALAERGRELVDLHGQHAHQSLLRPEQQRAALDRHAAVDLSEVSRAEARVRELRAANSGLGGDPRERARTVDLLTHQLREIEMAAIVSESEDEDLAAEESLLEATEALRAATDEAYDLVAGSGGAGGLDLASADGSGAALDLVGRARTTTERYEPLAGVAARLDAVAAELDDLAGELRHLRESFEDDPERLAAIGDRRRLLADLRRKYGDTLAEVSAFAASARADLDALASSEERRERLAVEEAAALEALAAAETRLGDRRRASASLLATELESRLEMLGMTGARLAVEVGAGRGDEVQFLLGANPGEVPLPLARVASGGELARAMLALRLVLTSAPPTLVFDEVDAGIGGAAAVAVGRALAEIGARHQVLVVTHLAQVAAFADHQIAVRKEVAGGRTLAQVEPVVGEDRLAELARMLSGRADSASGRAHAAELLADAGRRSAGAAAGSGSVEEEPLWTRP